MKKSWLMLQLMTVGVVLCCSVARGELIFQLKATDYDPLTGIWADSSGKGNHAVLVSGTVSLVEGQTPNGSGVLRFETPTVFQFNPELTFEGTPYAFGLARSAGQNDFHLVGEGVLHGWLGLSLLETGTETFVGDIAEIQLYDGFYPTLPGYGLLAAVTENVKKYYEDTYVTVPEPGCVTLIAGFVLIVAATQRRKRRGSFCQGALVSRKADHV